jgi:hypothetical protein
MTWLATGVTGNIWQALALIHAANGISTWRNKPGNTIRKDALLTNVKAVFKICPWILSTPPIGLLLPGETIVTVFANVDNFRNQTDTAMMF